MLINKILPAGCKVSGAIFTTAALMNIAACNNNNNNNNASICDNDTTFNNISKVEKIPANNTPDTEKNTDMLKYADLAIYYGWEEGKFNLKVEDGISFIADGIKYTSKDGLINGEFEDNTYNLLDENTFITDSHSFSSAAYQTIKMVANYTQEPEQKKDTLILSKDDIKAAQSKIKNGAIWEEGKEFFAKEGSKGNYIGKAEVTKKPNGAEINVNYMTAILSHTNFFYE